MIRLSLHVGRLDWENVLEELSPRQLTVLMAYSGIEPWGEDRADLRAGINTAGMMAAFGAKGVEVEQLSRYLKIHKEDERADASPERAAAFLRGALKR